MQYDLDIEGEFSEILKIIRKILLSYPQIKELKDAKQTSYSDEYGGVVHPEVTALEITAMNLEAGLLNLTSIVEAGNKHQIKSLA